MSGKAFQSSRYHKSCLDSEKRSKSLASLLSTNSSAGLGGRSNTANDLRTAKNLAKVRGFETEQMQRERRQLELEMRQRRLRKTNPAWERMKEDLIDYEEIEARKRERIDMQRERSREYHMELEEMEARVLQGPTLFERQSKVRVSWSNKMSIRMSLYYWPAHTYYLA